MVDLKKAWKRHPRAAIYARFSTRFQHSIEDQIRTCREWAERLGITVVFEFVDEAVTGKSCRRSGLRALQSALEKDEIDVVIVFTTNRLYRKMYQSLQFVEEEIVERGKRCVFVQSGIDTDDRDNWRQRLQLFALMDEFVIQTAGKHVQAAHEGLLLQTRVFGTETFGFGGEIIEGQTTRLGRPARRLIVDSVTSVCVKNVFHWFVNLRMSIAAITRRLNTEGVRTPARCQTKRWSRHIVRRILKNARYVGDWSYGMTQAVWLNKKGYSRNVPRAVPLRSLQIEELRIVDDVTWAKARERLTKLEVHAGRRSKDGDRRKRPRLLNGLLFCAKHTKRNLTVSGPNGQHMFCRACKEEPTSFLYSVLPRGLATRLLCERLAEMIQSDAELVEQSIASCRRHAEALQQPDQPTGADLDRQLSRLKNQIDFILDAPGETEEDRNENHARLEQLRHERAKIQRKIAEFERRKNLPKQIPTEDEVGDELARLGSILCRGSESEDREEFAMARNLVEELTGGRIVVSQCGERKRKKGWLRLTFTVDLLTHLVTAYGCQADPQPVEVTIDLLKPATIDEEADQVMALLNQGKLLIDVAAETGWGRNKIAGLRRHWHAQRGLPVPDARTRRSGLDRKQRGVPHYREIAEAAAELKRENLPNTQIAARLGFSTQTVENALEEWEDVTGEVFPTRGVRRAEAIALVRRLFDRDKSRKEIEEETGFSDVTILAMLKESFAAEGKTLPDGRTREQRRKRGA